MLLWLYRMMSAGGVLAARFCVLVALAVLVCGGWAAADVTVGRLALEDGFYALADRVLLDVLEDDDAALTDAALAAHYMLRSHLEQRRDDLLQADLERFAGQGLLADEAVVYWRTVRFVALEQWSEASALLASVDSASSQPSMYRTPLLRLKAWVHFKLGDMDTAASLFEQLDLTSENVADRAANRLDWGRALLAAGETAAAQQVWEPLLAATNLPRRLALDVAYWAGLACLLRDDPGRTTVLLKPLVNDPELAEPQRVRVATALAAAYRRTGEVAAGSAVLTNTLSTIRNPVLVTQTRWAFADHLLEVGSLDEATSEVQRFVASYPEAEQAPELMHRLGDALLAAARHIEAGDVFQKHLEAFGDGDGRAYVGKALALEGQGRHGEAALVFERAADLQGDLVLATESRFRAADAYFANGQYRRALEGYRRVKSDVESAGLAAMAQMRPRVWFQCAASLAALGERVEAIRAFEALAEAYPGNSIATDARLGVGDLQLEAGETESAESTFALVMQRGAEGAAFWRALHGRGMARYRRWAPDAIADFERVVEGAVGTPIAEHAHFMRAMCLYRLGRDAEALEICRDFLTRFPQSDWAAPVQYWVARLAYNAGNDEQAESAFLAFVETYPDHELAPQALLRAGLAALRRQQYLQAIEWLGRMAKDYPRSDLLADARFHQAEAMVQLGRFAAAILVYEEVINNYPGSHMAAMALGRKGDCQFTLGAENVARYEEAALSYQRLLQAPVLAIDDRLQAAYKLGQTYEKLGRAEEALDQYYSGVMLPFLAEKEKGGIPGEAAGVWFSRAARGAASLVEQREEWRRLVRILERVVSADVEFSAEARARIRTIKSDFWWLFY